MKFKRTVVDSTESPRPIRFRRRTVEEKEGEGRRRKEKLKREEIRKQTAIVSDFLEKTERNLVTTHSVLNSLLTSHYINQTCESRDEKKLVKISTII